MLAFVDHASGKQSLNLAPEKPARSSYIEHHFTAGLYSILTDEFKGPFFFLRACVCQVFALYMYFPNEKH